MHLSRASELMNARIQRQVFSIWVSAVLKACSMCKSTAITVVEHEQKYIP